jgi:hypothetical protein
MAKKGQPKTLGSGRKPRGTARETARRSAPTIKAWREAGMPEPLEIMLRAMREELHDEDNVRLHREHRRAFPYASACAVYFHAKPQAQLDVNLANPQETAAEIVAAIREIDLLTGSGK